jgi:hypothetical protein
LHGRFRFYVVATLIFSFRVVAGGDGCGFAFCQRVRVALSVFCTGRKSWFGILNAIL